MKKLIISFIIALITLTSCNTSEMLTVKQSVKFANKSPKWYLKHEPTIFLMKLEQPDSTFKSGINPYRKYINDVSSYGYDF